MSRSSRTTHPAMAPMPTPADRDVVMGPPPLPPQLALSGSGDSRSRENQEIADKYKKLKRKYHDLEDKHRETVLELRASGDRNVKWRSERAMLMERIVELEAQAVPHHSNVPYPVSSAYPRSLLQPAAQRRFAMNLDKAIVEAEHEDVSMEPLYNSKHVGPNARRRIEAEMKERIEEEQREARRTARRPRGRAIVKEKETASAAAAAAHARAAGGGMETSRDRMDVSRERDIHRGERERDRAEREREGTGPPLTLAPPPGSQRDSRSATSPSPSIVVTTSGGSTRLRIKPPVAQPSQHEPSPPPSPLPHRHAPHHPHRHIDNDYEEYPPQHDHEMQHQRELELQRERERRELEAQREREIQEKERMLALEREREREQQRQLEIERERAKEREREEREREERQREQELREREQREREKERERELEREREQRERERQQRERERELELEREREREERDRQMQLDHRAPSPPPPMEPLEPMRVSPVASAPPASPARRDSGPAPSPVTASLPPGIPTQGATEYPNSDRYPFPQAPRGEPQWGQWPPQSSATPSATSSREYRYGPVDPYERRHYPQYDEARSPVEMGARPSSQVHSPQVHSPHPAGPMPPYNYPQQIALGAGGGGPMPYFPHPGGPGNGGPPPGSRAKPKRLKAHTVTSRSYSIPMVPRDRKGKPLLPLNVGIMTVITLGEVCMREHFHTERYIFPVGYEVTRRYLSTVDPNAEVVYKCKILDGGDGPKFQITSDDLPEKTIVAGTATGAWSVIVRCANHIRNRQHSNSVSGPDFFGLGQNTIKHLIQELPGADRLRDYVWQNFVEGGPLGGRHAAVIPALPDGGDQDESGDGTVLNPNGSSMSVISMGATPSPQPAYDDGKPELQIIQMDAPEGSVIQTGPHPMASIMDRTPMKSITFHQERPPSERSGRSRRPSVQSLAEERERSASTAPRGPSRQHSTHSHSPVLPQRTQSHSPALHRGEREPYSPHGTYERSPFPPPAAPTPQQVPAPFASIMNAYNAPPKSPDSPYETTPMNGGVSRLRGSNSTGVER